MPDRQVQGLNLDSLSGTSGTIFPARRLVQYLVLKALNLPKRRVRVAAPYTEGICGIRAGEPRFYNGGLVSDNTNPLDRTMKGKSKWTYGFRKCTPQE